MKDRRSSTFFLTPEDWLHCHYRDKIPLIARGVPPEMFFHRLRFWFSMHILLILAQFLLAAAIVLSARWWPPDVAAVLLAAPGAAISVWAWVVMGLSRLRVMPSPSDHATLITRGPYRWVRHPMYTGVLWFTAALLISGFAWWRLGAWLALLAVLEAKSREEERLLAERFPDYRDYCQRTARFLPGIY